MATFQHPASLNALQQYAQACSILRNTSRATNTAWYQGALELDFQLHIRPDGPEITTFYHHASKKQWTHGPTLTEETLHDPSKLAALAAEALRHAGSNGATSLGVILHVADEFATTELKPDFDNPGSLPELRETAERDPAAILEDSSIQPDQATWRILPYPAQGSETIGTTVTVSRQYAPLLETFRAAGDKANFPVITHAVSAPLVAILGLSRMLKPTPDKPFVAVLQYPWFTVMAFFNEHADLSLVRTLPHRGVRRATNFRNALTTTSASLEFVDPDLYLVPLGHSVDNTLAANLRITFTNSRVETVEPLGEEGIPEWCPEPAIAAQRDEAVPFFTSHTFTILRDDRWALQNFLPTPNDVSEIYPNRAEMRLLRVLRLARVALFAVTLLSIAYFVLGIVDLVRRPEWGFDPMQAEAIKTRLAKLNSEKQKADHWNNLLDDRSKAWVTMESLSRMFPTSRGVMIKSFTMNAKPDSAGGNATTGFVKEWRIAGLARDEALEYLNSLNTREGISEHFAEVARSTGNSAFDPALGNRSISVNVRTLENATYKPMPPEEANPSDETSYPFTFDLRITQRFEATDPLALNVRPAP
ncbi:MAG: energy transducer TonB [Akkermansiaceae bacterium]|nr:energy transducer TonB [Akkermansiaceae bacterium]MCP5543188.1 energy transducer TonB [Akkermansiaceae bacterium]MCP5546330.1 energy transducer TonB [Akkermansiaceae bacterium]